MFSIASRRFRLEVRAAMSTASVIYPMVCDNGVDPTC